MVFNIILDTKMTLEKKLVSLILQFCAIKNNKYGYKIKVIENISI